MISSNVVAQLARPVEVVQVASVALNHVLLHFLRVHVQRDDGAEHGSLQWL